jgi:hypothetical protein
MTETNNRIHELKLEIVLRTLYPDALEDYRPEDERSLHIDQLKMELGSLGVDAERFQSETVAQHFGIQIINKVIEVDFPRQAS